MSIQAVAWALDQYIKDAATKLVLISLANYADKKTGECWPTVAKICEESCQSKSTVLRRLEWLIDRGLVVKIAVKEESGRQRANIYRLVLSRMLTPDDEIAGGECLSLVPRGGCLTDTPFDTPEGVTADTPIEPLYEPSISPIAPKGAVGEADIGLDKGWEADAGYQRLLEAYAPSLAWPKQRGYRHWRKLSDDDRAAAIAAVPAYREYCAKQRRKMSDPSAYLTGTFRNFKQQTVIRSPMSAAEEALRGSMAPGFSGGVLVEQGTDAWAAWQAVADIAGLPLRAIVYRRNPLAGRHSNVTGKYLPSKWPPSRDGPDRRQRAAGER